MKDLSLIEKKRHSLSHLMTMAVVERFPNAGLGVGPHIENGWYQDYDLPGNISEADFPWIEKRMRELIREDIEFNQEMHSLEESREFVKGDIYKTELTEDLIQKGETKLSFYRSGNFVNLCEGPHVAKTSEINPDAFKLVSVAGAYWRGNEKNKMLTRIYGVGFDTKEELDQHLAMQEEAKKRDHRKLGKDLDLFVFSDLVGAGLPLFTPNGEIVRRELEGYIRLLREAKGFQFVWIPHIAKSDLYKASGHWDKFEDDLFYVRSKKTDTEFVLKPMNCPHHIQIFASRKRSYREMPVRLAETTTIYRDENTGQLQGLTRVRSITQDDSHVFARKDQIKEETRLSQEIITSLYETIGVQLKIRLSTHDPEYMEKYLGTSEIWNEAERKLKEMLEEAHKEYNVGVGEAAFYGPKLDYIGIDSLGREWQLATIQLDMNQPARFQLAFTNEHGNDEQPVMIHVAVMGSTERFMGVLIEHLAGVFPVWLSPLQVAILPVGENFLSFAHELRDKFKKEGIRVEVDESNESVGKKIRNAEGMKVPYMLVVGEKERSSYAKASGDKASGKLAIRKRGEKDTKEIGVDEFVENILDEIKNRTA